MNDADMFLESLTKQMVVPPKGSTIGINEARVTDRRFTSSQAQAAGLSEFDPNSERGLKPFMNKRPEPSAAELEDAAPKQQRGWGRVRIANTSTPNAANVQQSTQMQQADRARITSRLMDVINGLNDDQLLKIANMAVQLKMSSRYPGGLVQGQP
jgi:hypothetical protein